MPGGCAAGSAQDLWLEADLAANSSKNVIAIWHKPRYSSGATNYQALQPLWDDLYAAGVDILLDGHDHIYERFAPMKSGATLASPPVADADLRDPPVHGRHRRRGAPRPRHDPSRPARSATTTTFGIFKLTLHATTYDWKFLPIAGSTFTDSGTGTVHGSSRDRARVLPRSEPPPPATPQATVTWSAPASNGGSAITGYVVTPYIGATAQSSTTVGNVATTPDHGLTNGTTYTFRVAAINAIGTGNQSANSNAVTPVAPATVPGCSHDRNGHRRQRRRRPSTGRHLPPTAAARSRATW